MNYKALVEDYRERLIDDLMGLLEIKSVKGEPTGSAPVGAGPKAALDYMLELGARDGHGHKGCGQHCRPYRSRRRG